MKMIETFMIIAGTISMCGLAAELIFISAPVGYQDERGFHMGEKPYEPASEGLCEAFG